MKKMANLDIIKIKKITITEGQNVRVENDPEILNDFLNNKMKITVTKIRNCVVLLDRLSSDQMKRMYIFY